MTARHIPIACMLLVFSVSALGDPDADLRRAVDYFLAGDAERAEQLLKPLTAMQPPFELAHLLLADVYAARAGHASVLRGSGSDLAPAKLTALRDELVARHAAPQLTDELLQTLITVPATISDLLFVDTRHARSYWLSQKDGALGVQQSFYTSIGKAGAGKRKAWDRRTPVGIYFIVDRLEDFELHAQYGTMAFPMDYPNGWDRYNQRTGDGIWLHGVERIGYSRPPLDSDGCVVLTNSDLRLLAPAIRARQFAVIVSDGPPTQGVSVDEHRDALHALAERWRALAESGDLSWFDLYSETFKPLAGDTASWREQNAAVFATVEQRIELGELFVATYPGESDLFVIRVAVTRTINETSRNYYQQLYVRYLGKGEYQIVAEGFG